MSPTRIISWNVNGLRACAKKGFGKWLGRSGAEIVGVQEVRAFLEIRKDEEAMEGGVPIWAPPLVEDPQLIPFSARHLAVMATRSDEADQELRNYEQNLQGLEPIQPGNTERRRMEERRAKLQSGQDTIMAVRRYRHKHPTVWSQSALAAVAAFLLPVPALGECLNMFIKD